jgi:hypothetical protein
VARRREALDGVPAFCVLELVEVPLIGSSRVVQAIFRLESRRSVQSQMINDTLRLAPLRKELLCPIDDYDGHGRPSSAATIR